MTGKLIAIVFGFGNLFVTAGVLSLINWRSRDFNLKKQRHKIRLVNLPKGKPAVAPIVRGAIVAQTSVCVWWRTQTEVLPRFK